MAEGHLGAKRLKRAPKSIPSDSPLKAVGPAAAALKFMISRGGPILSALI